MSDNKVLDDYSMQISEMNDRKYHKRQENCQYSTCICTTCEAEQCYLKVHLNQFEMCIVNTGESTKIIFKRSITDMLREQRKYNYIKWSTEPRGRRKSRLSYNRKQLQTQLILIQVYQSSLNVSGLNKSIKRQ